MKKKLLFIISLILTIKGYTQKKFNEGYFITNYGEEIKCSIKNLDNQDTPSEIEYKLSATSESKKINSTAIREFGIYKKAKYSSNKVQIDRSTENISDLSDDKNPIFKEEQLFLKVLVEGKATLYYYREGNLIRYFYKGEGADIRQLIFKKYQISEDQIGENNEYRKQLWTDLKCSTIKFSSLKNLSYTKNELQNFFINYNNCVNSEYINYSEEENNILFHVRLRAHANNSSLTIQNPNAPFPYVDYGNQSGIGFGVEFEALLPFNRNKWGISIEPTYQSFKNKKYVQKIFQDTKF